MSLENAKPLMVIAPVQDELPGMPVGFEVVQRVLAAKKQGKYSGLLARERQEYEQVVRWLADDRLSISEVNRLSKWDRRTLSAILESDAERIAQEKSKLGGTFLKMARLSAERFEEALHNNLVEPRDLIIASGVFAQRGVELMGVGMEVSGQKGCGQGFDPEKFNAWVDALPVVVTESQSVVNTEEIGTKARDVLAECSSEGGLVPASGDQVKEGGEGVSNPAGTGGIDG